MNENTPNGNASKSIVDLFKAYYKYSTLTLTQKMTVISVSLIIFLIFFSLSLFGFLFLGIGFGYWIGKYFGSVMIGFFVLAGIFFLLITITYLLRKVIIRKLRDYIVKKVYN